MRCKWEFLPPADFSLTQKLASELSLPEVVAKILASRGIKTSLEAERFLKPKLSQLYDPFILKDVDKGVNRVIHALKENQKIMIFGDYDVDGITATSLVFLVLNRLGGDVSYYLPNRLIEGYGLSEEGIVEAEKRGAHLLITVDCGVTASKEVDFANSKGIDCIITDHHEPSDILPNAYAIIDPKQKDKEYPGGELSGVGVAFKFAQALYKKLGQDESELEEHLDLVALGTSADIVPLVGENRILTRFGMTQIARTTKPGLKSLIFIAGIMGKEIGTGQIVYVLAPRINAVGRLGDAEKAIRLLTTKNHELGARLARELDEDNRKRKLIDETTLEEALKMIEENADLSSDKVIVLSSPSWHQGVIGIVASRLVERFHRPTILIAIDGDEGKGSARSIPEFHLHDALRECKEFLLKYGGHKYAAGLSILPENINFLREKLKIISDRKLKDEDLIPKISIDLEVELEWIDNKLVDTLELFSPFGPQNLRPVFITKNLEVFGEPYIVGNNHLRFKVKKNDRVFDAIGFGLGNWAKPLSMKKIKIDLVYVVGKNEWNESIQLQLQVRDLRITEI